MPPTSRRLFGPLMGIAVALLLPHLPVQAEGKLDVVATFEDGNLGLDVVTYIIPTASPSRIALLGFRSPTARTSFVFSLNEWASLFDLWTTAVRAQSASWKFIGSLTEIGTVDASLLTVSAGPGVRLAVRSLKGASITYVLAKADIDRFEKALLHVMDFLSKESVMMRRLATIESRRVDELWAKVDDGMKG
jgi:hypothetical protein